MGRARTYLQNFWHDADRRRAFALSLVAHLFTLLLFVLWLSQPRSVPLENYVVIDFGTPEQADSVTEAPTVADDAPTAPTPLVEHEESGEPQARSADEEQTTAPEPDRRTEQPAPQPLAEPQQQAAQERTSPEPSPSRDEADSRQPAPRAPAPPVRQPDVRASAPDLPEAATAATVLPEIDEVELEPQAAQQAVTIPMPAAAARVPEARNLAVSPSVQVAAPQEVPTPQVSAEVAEAAPIPQPNVSAAVPEAQPVPEPSARAEVVAAEEIPQPRATAEVASARSVPTPRATAQVAPAQSVPRPGVQADVAEARPVEVAAQVAVARPLTVPQPSIRAEVAQPESQVGAELVGAAPAGPEQVRSNRADERITGGDADRGAQTRAVEEAEAGNAGRARDTAEGEATGARPVRPQIPYRESRERPLAVLIDNFRGYPQAGLAEASRIAEMPVEGGLTRLMTIYDRRDPRQVGPIRSARDYFVELARSYNGVLVHDGGSPAALAAIERSGQPTLNAYRQGDLFSRQGGRDAPYNLYSNGGPLREAVNRLQLERTSELAGVVPRAPEEAEAAESVEIRFGQEYRSGFRYVQNLDMYRWVRNGENAVDFQGEAIYVDAILVASIDARSIPDDPAGRLYIPVRGGAATLYLDGRALPGRWSPGEGNGVEFVRADGESVDLAPFKLWIVFAPGSAQVAQN